MNESSVVIIVSLLSIIIYLIGIQRYEWENEAYWRGFHDRELKATDYNKYLEELERRNIDSK